MVEKKVVEGILLHQLEGGGAVTPASAFRVCYEEAHAGPQMQGVEVVEVYHSQGRFSFEVQQEARTAHAKRGAAELALHVVEHLGMRQWPPGPAEFPNSRVVLPGKELLHIAPIGAAKTKRG